MADLKSFSGDSDDDFRSEKEKNQISKKRKKNPLYGRAESHLLTKPLFSLKKSV